jgi:hypothetical protein
VLASARAIDWTGVYEPAGRLVVNVGPTPSGTVIARFLGGAAAADSATVLAYGTVSMASPDLSPSTSTHGLQAAT